MTDKRFKQCFQADEDGHWYLIDEKDVELFDKLLYDENDDDCEKFNKRFAGSMLK